MKINGYEILYLTDIGSRARGLASPTSDHDLFAIFRQPVEDYIKLKSYEPDFNINDIHCLGVDFLKNYHQGGSLQGMNIRKFCELLRKSNPTAIEMCISPIVHYDEIGKDRLIELAKANFNPIALWNHYNHLSNDNYRKYIKNKTDITVKRYLNILRGIDNANFIFLNKKIPPMNYEECISSIYAPQSPQDEVRRKLIEFKKNGITFNMEFPKLNSTIESILSQIPNLDHLNNPPRDCDKLDELLCEFILKGE